MCDFFQFLEFLADEDVLIYLSIFFLRFSLECILVRFFPVEVSGSAGCIFWDQRCCTVYCKSKLNPPSADATALLAFLYVPVIPNMCTEQHEVKHSKMFDAV